MLSQRRFLCDLTALALGAVVVLLALALAAYDRADPLPPLWPPLSWVYQPDLHVFPLHEKVNNPCGWWGAVAADLLYSTLGLGAWYLLLGALSLAWQLIRRQALEMPVLRLVGFAISLAGFTTLLALALPGWTPGPVVGSGGYLGMLGRAVALAYFAHVGGIILAISATLAGLLLWTDYAVVHALVWLWQHWPRRLARRKVATVPECAESSSTTRPKRGRTDLDAAAAGQVPLKIRQKGLASQNAATTPPGEAHEPEKSDNIDAGSSISGPVTEPETNSGALTADPAGSAAEQGSLRVRHPAERRKQAEAREREELIRRIHESPGDVEEYDLPSLDLLLPSDDIDFESQAAEVRRKAKILEKTFADFGFTVKVVEIETGPVIAQYEVELEAGLRLSKITGLADDLAIALRVPSVRIVAPIPGKNTVGIEVPNEQRQIVRLREVIEEAGPVVRKMRIPLFLGKDVSGNPLTVDLSTLPHLLIAGRTGTGKSVCLNAIISSILMTRRPDEVRLLLIDPKMVELSGYGRLPHLMHPVVTDMRKAEAILAWAVEKMEERYALLARAGVRHISSYNQLGEEELMERLQPETEEERQSIPLQLPFIVIVADEMADLMMTAGKEVEQHIIRLAQKSRAVGIHLILATQKPTVDVITGLIKSNLPARIAFQVASRTDSRVVLDEMGADKLLGNGDMLFLWPGTSTLLRGQGTYVSDEEINRIVAHCSRGEQHFVQELVNMKVKDPVAEGEGKGLSLSRRDELYEAAVELVIREGRGSVSLLQRALGIGYGRAARLIDFMAEDGIVGQYNGSQAREVLISLAQWEQMQGASPEEEPSRPASSTGASGVVAPPRPTRRGHLVLRGEDEPLASLPSPTRHALPKARELDAEPVPQRPTRGTSSTVAVVSLEQADSHARPSESDE
jgi:S-DNA-T family DNA segregation ATPase FtsK/SpoIIIE